MRKLLPSLLLLLIVVTTLSFAVLAHTHATKALVDDKIPTASVPFVARPLEDTSMTVLFIGVDARNVHEAGRADSIIMARISPQTRKVTLLSIPRDSRVTYVGHGFVDKINATMNSGYVDDGGIQLLEATIEQMMPGVHIDGYVKANFEGFAKVVDLLGGIDYNIEKDMYYRSADTFIDLKAGQQHLTGDQALGYMRFRHDGIGDFATSKGEEFGRVLRQKKMLSAIIEKASGIGTIAKIPTLLETARKYVETDISLAKGVGLSSSFIGHATTVTTIPFPTDKIQTVVENGQPKSYVFPDFHALSTTATQQFLGQGN